MFCENCETFFGVAGCMYHVCFLGKRGNGEIMKNDVIIDKQHADCATLVVDIVQDMVVFVAAQENLDIRELFSVSIEGPASAAIKLSKTMPTGGNVGNAPNRTAFAISPDGARVVYMADQDVDETFELYSVPVEGPPASGVKLNPPLVSGGNAVSNLLDGLFGAQISPDSQWVGAVRFFGRGAQRRTAFPHQLQRTVFASGP